ncbi:LOW QUALITY PROTEIN: prolyl 4-hydroxylase subunit alpha-2-like [Glossina fuscipes]|uniref:procollagen-proline 4-dioxygenase n=1 Tax=Glossina fuscipes TaxID=7396 RepID=A0A8U0WHS4_9MUSC|nr:LOW QUALITY PROTEIN: prolyl 4-hydroxylase subunit alpha-2-like [Glossina fuscipes]
MNLFSDIFSTVILLSSTFAEEIFVERSFATSVAIMTSLLHTEERLLKNLTMHIAKLENKVEILKSLIEKLKADNLESLQDPESYLSNPFNYFGLIRHMQADWTSIGHYILEPMGEEYPGAMADHHIEMPTSTDLEEAVEGMHRLQTIWNLDVYDMSKGILNGQQYEARLSSLDLYTIAVHLFYQKYYRDAAYWVIYSILSYEADSLNEFLGCDRSEMLVLYAEILMHLSKYLKINAVYINISLLTFIVERPKNALTILHSGLQLEPSSLKLLERKNEIETLTKNGTITPYQYLDDEAINEYEFSCHDKLPNTYGKLYCVYNTNTSAFLRLAPLKMELLSLDPYMVLYHDVLTNNEITRIQRWATPHLQRAMVYDYRIHMETTVKGRTSQATTVPEFGELNERITQRVTDMTGLDMSASEPFQILNYGIGGHNVIHNDCFNVPMTNELVQKDGDRIATVLFYMTDVEHGGDTVFPIIEKAIHPQKATALFWYNLDNDLQMDLNTLHEACPVIVGSKWSMSYFNIHFSKLTY